jgi:hypothetical protein
MLTHKYAPEQLDGPASVYIPHHVVEVEPQMYRKVFKLARTLDPLVAEFTSRFDDSLRGRYFLTEDGQSGYAIRPDGELVLLFSLVKGRGRILVASAIANGARRLDCFDGYLPGLYAQHGFREVERVANWTAGEPDVVFMELV